MKHRLKALCFGLAALAAQPLCAQESLWIEAEHLDGITGYCWPMGKPEMKKTAGHWALSGPGWAAEWNQGGESGFLSIATGVGDDKGVATKDIEIPADGTYRVWVRYADRRELPERFQIKLEQAGGQPWTGTYGENAAVEEDNEAKLYWGWAFAWDQREVSLKKGAAKLSLLGAFADPEPRQIDVIVLTTDKEYRPYIKERPKYPAWDYLASIRGVARDLEPLARHRPDKDIPKAWTPRTFQDKGFLYLWNVSEDMKWASDDPNRVPVPYHMRDADVLEAFEKKHAGKTDVPIFSDPRIVPTYHGVGPRLLQSDAPNEATKTGSQRLMKWLDANPNRYFASMMNYFPDTPLTPTAVDNFAKYRNRYVGSIAGENIGYYHIDNKVLEEATKNHKSRRAIAGEIKRLGLEANAAKYRAVMGQEPQDHFKDVISCQSVGMVQFAPLLYEWGARTVGFESAVATWGLLPMRMAFLRGAARQNGGLTATYRSANFGDSATMFSTSGNFSQPQNIFDNYYSVYSGAGMTWYKFDIWYQYMAGTSMFYHEQGFDEYWMPGGTTAAGRWEVQLSPKGKLVDRFLRTTAKDFDRGTPYTPVAFLVDFAHGWDPTNNWPGEWNHHGAIPHENTKWSGHHQMMQEYIFTAYYPIYPRSQAPITATSESYTQGVFGDIFDVVYAYPDVKKWTTIDTYPVVIATGEIEMTEPEAKRLSDYVNGGGTLLIADAQLPAAAAKALELPESGAEAQTSSFRFMDDATDLPSQAFKFKPIEGGKAVATTTDGKVFCASFDRGKGRLIYLSVPRGLGIDNTAHPVVPRLFAHLTQGLTPVRVEGDVEWALNRNDKGWMVTLMNPDGQGKPQQGVNPTDYRQNRTITIKTELPIKSAVDRLLPTDQLKIESTGKERSVTLVVPAGAVRIVELN